MYDEDDVEELIENDSDDDDNNDHDDDAQPCADGEHKRNEIMSNLPKHYLLQE